MKFFPDNFRRVCCAFACVLLIALGAACDRETPPETLFSGGYEEAEMDAAMDNARASVDDFLEVLQTGEVEDYSIKVAIEDGELVEHFWTTDVTYSDGAFTAKIGNDAGLVKGVALGDEVTSGKDEISDWLYIKDGLMHGNYTLRVLLPEMDPEEAEMWKSRMAPLSE